MTMVNSASGDESAPFDHPRDFVIFLQTKFAKTVLYYIYFLFVQTFVLYTLARSWIIAMSSETAAARKNRSSVNPASEGDHRKRRRNRTTQSCLNCHTSKRMCDRKRPACARCTQLGLTGLCVYEVDDPNQRSDSQDECARLLKRVAELEGVIRELKNKPHPKWIQTTGKTAGKIGRGALGCHSRTTSEGGQDSVSSPPSPPSSLSDKSELEASSPDNCSTRSSSMGHAYPSTILLNTVDRQPSQKTSSPVQSTPSPGLVTAADGFSHISLVSQPEASQEYGLASAFNPSYPGLMGCEPYTPFGAVGKGSVPMDSYTQKTCPSQCGCLHETASYNVLLELSLRLRRTVDVLARSASHQLGQMCQLHHRISELDTMTIGALGSVSTPSDDLQTSIVPHLPCTQSSAVNSLQLLAPPKFAQPWRLTISPESLPNLTSLDLLPTVTYSPSSPCEDDFMTWEPSRRL